MIGRVTLLLGSAALLVCLGASSASAQNGILFGSAGGYGIGTYNYGTDINTPSIPYYSLYPPVYYSHPVPRPYGYSPFAYPPGTMTPDIAPTVMPAQYINPYVPNQKNVKSTVDKSVGRVYYNPFVQQARAASEVK